MFTSLYNGFSVAFQINCIRIAGIMTVLDALLLIIAAFLGGMLNSVAGGGSFLTFPALVFTGVDPITANATNTVMLWPGAIGSVGGFRHELSAARRTAIVLSAVSLGGGLVGALLLLWFRDYREAFEAIVPYLLLFASLIFAFGGYFARWMQEHAGLHHTSTTALVLVSVLQFIISIYGGFFGGGMGVMMLAAYALLGMDNIHIMNAIKSLVSVLIKGIAAITFVVSSLFLSGVVTWPQAIVMTIGATVGGYVGAHYSRQLDPTRVKRVVIVLAFIITALFFIYG
jgi:hypothetical protein